MAVSQQGVERGGWSHPAIGATRTERGDAGSCAGGPLTFQPLEDVRSGLKTRVDSARRKPQWWRYLNGTDTALHGH
jgi:hypothetical protein